MKNEKSKTQIDRREMRDLAGQKTRVVARLLRGGNRNAARLTTGGSWLHQGGCLPLLVWVWVCRQMGWPGANRQDESD